MDIPSARFMFEAALSANFANASAVPGFGTGGPEGRGIAAFFDTFFSVNDALLITEDALAEVLLAAELVLAAGAEELLFDTLFPLNDALVGTDVITIVVFAAGMASGGGPEYP